MKIIRHRANTLEALRAIPHTHGVEIDIRTQNNKLILSHDPFTHGILFEDWLAEYNHGTLILNVKEEGLEQRCLYLLKRKDIQDFFFLDQSFPFLLKTINSGESRVAVRLSEYESIATSLTLANKAQWVWIDYFTKLPLSYHDFQVLKSFNFKLCLVSPELQGYPTSIVTTLSRELSAASIHLDAVCTKHPELWLPC